MLNVAQEELQAAVAQLEQAMYHHEQWYGALNRTLICRLPHDKHDVQPNAHHECRFGQWFYRHASQALREHPAFIAIESVHERMHQLAARLLITTAAGRTIPPHDFDGFSNALERLRLEILTLRKELEDMLYNRDALTGAQSRIGMLTRLREQQELVKRHIQFCAIAMMDLDRFKRVNDTHGHQIGDCVLAGTARFVIENLRPYDKLFRYGGEEFLICMQNADLKTGHALVERIREGLAAKPLDCGGEPLFITASFGLTLLDPDVPIEQSVDRSDRALYAAKHAGRNCTRSWEPSM